MNMTLVVMAAGMGSRFGGLKQVAAVGPGGEAILDFSVYDAKKAGFDKVVFVIKHSIEEEFKETVGKRVEKLLPVEYVFQELDKIPEGYEVPADREKPWGTGHAILCCKDVVKTPFAVINADDFYGASAYKKIAEGLSSGNDYCMVGYKLINTVTENGYVSRGVCTVENGNLVSVKETYNIVVDENDVISDSVEGVLDPGALVSMNLWGFLPNFFDYAKDYFDDFLRSLPEDAIKAECALPTMVDSMIKGGKLKVDVLTTDSVWFGVTYKEDKAYVAGELRKMHESGKYPERLF